MKQQKQTAEQVETSTAIATFQTGQDVKTAVLIVSVLANVALFVMWLILQLTSRYDAAVTSWFIS